MDLSSPLLPLLGLIGAALAGKHALTGVDAPKGRRSKNQASSSGPTGMTPTNRADVRVRPPLSTNVPRSIPRQVSNQVVWDVVKIDTLFTSSTTAVTENNFAANLAIHPQAGSWSVLFDQWTIPQFSVSFESIAPPGATASVNRVYTALDFDSNGNLGTVQAIEDYSTCQVNTISTGEKWVRTVRPCCKPLTSQTGQGTQRLWIDSGTTGVNFYGIRFLIPIVPVVNSVNTTLTIWFAFRNQI